MNRSATASDSRAAPVASGQTSGQATLAATAMIWLASYALSY